ncbi:MAG: penicillin-insensitive murein endopeptidase [Polyangiales bacterium]|jgi:penicillin-insensitive murein endopeptidase
MLRFFTALAITVICSCATEPTPRGQTISVGTSDRGYLRDAIALPERGEGYRRLRPGEGTRYGTSTLVAAIEHAARAVALAFPGGYPLRVGDLSAQRGGTHPRHRSHRAGRDADLLFFVRDAGGITALNTGWARFDGLGLAAVSGRVLAFDEARNWHLVRTLVMDDEARVKWLFCSNELKARLLRYAARHEPSPEAVLRATWVLHEPSRGDTHDDHFHLRVGCSRGEQSFGCTEEAPHWPWLTDPARKDDGAARVAASDTHLVGWLLAEEHVDQRGHVAWRRFDATPQPPLATTR